MNTFCNPTDLIFLPKLSSLHHKTSLTTLKCTTTTTITASSTPDIDMFKNKQGIYTPKPKKVSILWDLDNKPPRGPPYQAALALKTLAQHLGTVDNISAYANRHAFIHLPQWVREQRSSRKHQDILERKGAITPSQPYVCNVCGRKCKTNVDLTKHFKQLHVREREKKVNRMRQLKGKKRLRFKERFVSGNVKYEEAARELVRPKVGYGLAEELRRAGVFVKMVEDKPQSADWALKRQMQHCVSRGIDWVFLVTDDSDFSDVLRRAREEGGLRTVVIGDSDRALGRFADLWVPWDGVENGDIGEEELFSATTSRERYEHLSEDGGLFSLVGEDGDSDYDSDVDGIVDELGGLDSGVTISAFSEGEEEGEEEVVRNEFEKKGTDNGVGRISPSLVEKDLFWDSDDEEDGFL